MIVFAAIYEHRHGRDMRVFKTRESALGWKADIAAEYWEHEFGADKPKPTDFDDMVDAYWLDIEDEWFGMEETTLED